MNIVPVIDGGVFHNYTCSRVQAAVFTKTFYHENYHIYGINFVDFAE